MLKRGQRVKIQYAGSLEDGYTFVNTWVNGGPVEVTVGEGGRLPLFETALAGLSSGERTTITIPAAQAYGDYDEANIVTVPASKVPNAENLSVGSHVTLQTALGPVQVKVQGIADGNITFDCNHELAGHDITFEIELVSDGTESAVELEEMAADAGCSCGCDKLRDYLVGDGCHHDHADERVRA